MSCVFQSRLAALANKCKGPDDVEYFILEAGSLSGLNIPTEAGAKVSLLGCRVLLQQLSDHELCMHGALPRPPAPKLDRTQWNVSLCRGFWRCTHQ